MPRDEFADVADEGRRNCWQGAGTGLHPYLQMMLRA